MAELLLTITTIAGIIYKVYTFFKIFLDDLITLFNTIKSCVLVVFDFVSVFPQEYFIIGYATLAVSIIYLVFGRMYNNKK